MEQGASTGFGLLDVSTAQRFYQTNFDRTAVEGKTLQAAFYFGVNEWFVPESQVELGVELAMTVVPGGKVGRTAGKGLVKSFEYAVKRLGANPNESRASAASVLD